MSKAEQFVKDCTRDCSNLVVSLDSDIVCSNTPWLTPDQALRAVEIAREEMIDKAYEWINLQLNLPSDFEQHFRKAMKE